MATRDAAEAAPGTDAQSIFANCENGDFKMDGTVCCTAPFAVRQTEGMFGNWQHACRFYPMHLSYTAFKQTQPVASSMDNGGHFNSAFDQKIADNVVLGRMPGGKDVKSRT